MNTLQKKLNDSILPTYKASLKTRSLLKRNEKLLLENLADIIGIGDKLNLTVVLSQCILKLEVVIKGVKYAVVRQENIRVNPKDPVSYSYFVTASPCGPKRAFVLPGFSPFTDKFAYFCNMKKFDIRCTVDHHSFRRRMIYLENEAMKAGQAVASLVISDIITHLNRIVKPTKRSNK